MLTGILKNHRRSIRSIGEDILYRFPFLSYFFFKRGKKFRVRLAVEAGNYEQALILTKDQDNSGKISSARIKSLLALGFWSEAKDLLKKLEASGQLEYEMMSQLAELYITSSKYEKALAILEKSILFFPSKPSPRCQYAEVLFEIGEVKKAKEVLFSVMRQHPRRSEPIWKYSERVFTSADFYELYDEWLKNIKNGQAFYSTCLAMAFAARQACEFENARQIMSAAICHILDDPPPVPKQSVLKGGVGNVALIDLKEEMDKYGVPFFLISGTLLGAIREGKTLDFDKDIDVAIFDDVDREKVKDIFRSSKKFRLKVTHPQSDKIWISHYTGVLIDIFIEYRTPKKFYHLGAFAKWNYTPFNLKPINILDKEFLVPDNPELYLSENYGEKWRIPDPIFDALYEAPNIEILNREYLNAHVYRQIFKAVRVRNKPMLRKYINDFRSLIKNEPWFYRILALSK